MLPVAVTNLLSPAILFFALGMMAALIKSDLTIPKDVSSGLALFLMMAIGYRGGIELYHSGITLQVGAALAAAVVLGVAQPYAAFWILTRFGKVDPINAGAIAAHYGSISAVTFAAATSFFGQMGIVISGFMVAAAAVMEAPGIITGIVLARTSAAAEDREVGGEGASLKHLVHEALTGGSIVVLMGSLVIGVVTGDRGAEIMRPLIGDLFQAVLAFFLLDMGLTAARRLGDFLRVGRFLILFGIGMPVIGGVAGAVVGRLIGLSPADAALLSILAASASYIAAPAAVRISLPQANPSLSITLALGITFPFNIVVGIPIYYALSLALA